MNIRDSLNKIPFPQIYALIIFPTNEMSSLIGTRFNSILYFWTKDGVYIYSLIFLFLSLLLSIFMFFYSIFVFVKNKKLLKNTNKTLKEIFFIFLIFIPITILSFIIFRSKSGTFHYLYSAFSISFITFIIFFKINENRLKNIEIIMK